jgi:hypothetical protein
MKTYKEIAMKTQHEGNKISAPKLAAYAVCSMLLFTRCTQQIPGEFLLQQQNETFSGQTKVQINTKIDMLWVVDNSSSMDVEQAKLRSGFAAFAQKYMQPTWDIHLAVIPTDLYLAAPEFSNYRNTVLSGSNNYVSPTMNVNFVGSTAFPSSLSAYSVYNSGASKWELPGSGIILSALNPSWNIGTSSTLDDNYSLLNSTIFSSSVHDGPIPGFCNEYVPYFLWGATHCNWREESAVLAADSGLTTYNGQSVTTATANCLNGDSNTGSSEDINSATAKCVNTIVNNNIHSGNPVISTLGANTQSLINNFTINITTGTAGHGSERGMQSVLQLLADNEKSGSSSAFFRKGATRIIIFVTDEEDQTMVAETPAEIAGETGYGPFTHYFCDQASLLASGNPAGLVNTSSGFCCNNSSCEFGTGGGNYPGTVASGLSCKFGNAQYKNISGSGDGTLGSSNGSGYTIGICPDPAKLVAVSAIKSQLDSFFLALDGAGATSPNYSVFPIVPLTGASITTLQEDRNYDDTSVLSASGNNQGLNMWAVDRGDRYIQLGTLVGNGSTALDLASSDYSGVLNSIGEELTTQKGTFTLNRAPTSQEQTIVEVAHGDGSVTVINSSQYSLNGNILTITDINVILSFASTDTIVVNYQPLTSV